MIMSGDSVNRRKGSQSEVGLPRVGLDIGCLYVKAVLMRDSGSTPEEKYFEPLRGDPATRVEEVLRNLGVLDRPALIGVTGANAGVLEGAVPVLNPVRALRKAVLSRLPNIRNIIDIGGCSVTLIRLDEEGDFVSYTTNSLCAAGTGSFLDEQAGRLGISYEDTHSFQKIEAPPSIATRCAVFAKTDLIHRQQEGYSREALWSGLCKGMTNTFMQILLRGGRLVGPTAVTGGVALNDEIMRWLTEQFGTGISRFPDSVFAQALGSAMIATEPPVVLKRDLIRRKTTERDAGRSRAPLVLEKTRYPDMTVPEEWLDESGTEIRIHKPLLKEMNVYMGIDVGSTSTKLALVDDGEEVVMDLYRKTSGDPIGATRLLFSAMNEIERNKLVDFRILGAATTGSGRRLVGKLVGADLIVNEITAHATGTLQVDPEIETVFEIGGQDSKYMYLKNGRMSQCNMNYVCAAGTGSFVEEQANKLGFSVAEVGDRVMGLRAPPSSERCTVFMQQDLTDLLTRGYGKEEALAAVMYSVAQNYLTKVVGKRPVSPRKVFFQGATARNKALVAAFEKILDREIVVSPLCHIMGAYGAALLVKRSRKSETGFKGFSLLDRKLTLTYERCDLCTNHCKITFAQFEGEEERPSWGYMCGRDPDDRGKRKVEGYSAFQKRKTALARAGNVDVKEPLATLGIPRCLVNYTYLPLWKKFLGELGFRVKLSGATDDEIVREGIENTGADYCYPIKVAHGHVSKLLASKEIDKVFLPHLIGFVPEKSSFPVGYFCPYVQSFPSVAKATFKEEIITPVVDFHWTVRRIVSELYAVLGERFGITRKMIREAWKEATLVQKDFLASLQKEGREVIKNLDGKGVVIVGRPYNMLDERVSLNIPYKLAEGFDLTVLPVDMVPFEPEGIDRAFKMFWNYGKVILNALKFVRENPDWYCVFLSNFGCGPDSYILSYAEEMMEDKPLLILELDEHGSDAGYQTRIEAFMDAVESTSRKSYPTFDWSIMDERDGMKDRVIWIPPMHPVGARLFAAAFRRYGYKAQTLPEETPEILETGRSLVRGSECLPTALTIGNFVHKMREIDGDPKEHAFFMATSDGPCRFGQYIVLHRLILDRAGFGDVALVAPSSYNQYAGLPERMRPFLWETILMSDVLYKARCKLRPYEVHEGETERVLEEAVLAMEEAISEGREVGRAFENVLSRFEQIEVAGPRKPLVGIVGEIYVRCNLFSNDYVVRAVEDAGGEAWLAPLSEWFLYTGFMQKWHARHRGDVRGMMRAYLKDTYLHRHERRMYAKTRAIVGDRTEPEVEEVMDRAARYVPVNFGGEAALTLGRASLFAEHGARMVVNVAPFTCMPGTITTAMFNHIQEEMGVPIVSLFFDGQSGESSHIRTYIENLPEEKRG
jgi:predicted CoA-substrate-specific enzyme activase